MSRRGRGLTAAIIGACVLSLAACSSSSSATGSASASASRSASAAPTLLSFVNGTAQENNAPANTGDLYQGASSNPAAQQWVELRATAVNGLDPVVANGAGFTLYRFNNDTSNPSKSNCSGSCAVKWPPVLVMPGSKVYLDGVSQSAVGAVKRSDGTLQITLDGQPVYRFSGDTKAGQTNGEGVDGTWYGVTPDGGKALPASGTSSSAGLNDVDGTAQENHAPSNTGNFYNGPSDAAPATQWTQLTASAANGLDPIVVNGVGRTLYRFDEDSTSPSKSNCSGSCAVKWPPVLVKSGSKVFLNGVSASLVGATERSDGSEQLTLDGSPIYTFSGDTGPGQTNGEGVDGTWYAITPTGGKALPFTTSSNSGSSQSSPSPSATAGDTSTGTSSSPALGSGSVILDSGQNQTEPDGSTSVAGPGCQNLGEPFNALSLQLSGGPIEIFTGSNCTGTSALVTGSVSDLSQIGFIAPVASVQFSS
jgi:predicted lipoprotein with Yx(FWY)xxD motif